MGGWAKRSERDPEDDFAPRAYETSAMKRIFCLSLLPGIAAAFVASPASAQIRPRPAIQAAPDPPAAAPTPPPGARPPSATPNPPLPAQNGAPAAAPAAGAPGAPVKSGKPGDTASLPQFEQGVDFEPKNPDYKVAFSLEDADLPEIVRVIGQLTGKRFIFGGKVRNI